MDDGVKLTPASDLQGVTLADIPMLSVRAATPLTLKIRVGNKVAVVNNGALPVKVMPGNLVCAFGKGKFVAKASPETVNPDKEILYDLVDHKSHVMFGSTMAEVGEILKQKQNTLPTANITYHNLVYTEGANFKLNRSHHVCFVPNDVTPAQHAAEAEEGDGADPGESGSVSSFQASAGAMLPVKTWGTPHTKVIWAVNWKAKGLMPIRPQVVFTTECTIPPGQALELVV